MANFTEKRLCRSFAFKKEAPTQVFSDGFCEIFKSDFFTEHLRETASMTILSTSKNISLFSLVSDNRTKEKKRQQISKISKIKERHLVFSLQLFFDILSASHYYLLNCLGMICKHKRNAMKTKKKAWN